MLALFDQPYMINTLDIHSFVLVFSSKNTKEFRLKGCVTLKKWIQKQPDSVFIFNEDILETVSLFPIVLSMWMYGKFFCKYSAQRITTDEHTENTHTETGDGTFHSFLLTQQEAEMWQCSSTTQLKI